MFFVAEILRHRQSSQSDTKSRPWRLRHLAVDQRAARFLRIAGNDDARLLKFEPQVVALAGALADSGEHRNSAVLHGDVVDQLLNQHGFSDARAAEQTDLAALQVGLE